MPLPSWISRLWRRRRPSKLEANLMRLHDEGEHWPFPEKFCPKCKRRSSSKDTVTEPTTQAAPTIEERKAIIARLAGQGAGTDLGTTYIIGIVTVGQVRALIADLDHAEAEYEKLRRISIDDNEALQQEEKLREAAEAKVKELGEALEEWLAAKDGMGEISLDDAQLGVQRIVQAEEQARAALKGDQHHACASLEEAREKECEICLSRMP